MPIKFAGRRTMLHTKLRSASCSQKHLLLGVGYVPFTALRIISSVTLRRREQLIWCPPLRNGAAGGWNGFCFCFFLFLICRQFCWFSSLPRPARVKAGTWIDHYLVNFPSTKQYGCQDGAPSNASRLAVVEWSKGCESSWPPFLYFYEAKDKATRGKAREKQLVARARKPHCWQGDATSSIRGIQEDIPEL